MNKTGNFIVGNLLYTMAVGSTIGFIDSALDFHEYKIKENLEHRTQVDKPIEKCASHYNPKWPYFFNSVIMGITSLALISYGNTLLKRKDCKKIQLNEKLKF